MNFEPITDERAKVCFHALTRNGAIGVIIVSCEGCRIIRSFEPIRSGYQWHVSVSRDSKPVSWELAERFARELVPAVEIWDRDCKSDRCTHLWERPA